MTIKQHIINTAAAAIALGIGSTAITVKVNDALQDQRISRLENLDANVSGLRDDLQRVDKHLSQIDGKLQQQDLDHER